MAAHISQDIATATKVYMDKECEPTWHCVVSPDADHYICGSRLVIAFMSLV